MGRHGLSRPAGAIRRQCPPPHDVWQRDLLTGTLALSLEIPAGQFVSPATGRLGLIGYGGAPAAGQEAREEIVAQRAATSGGVPVLPGSGIKGAVRTIFELLSFSCDPLLHGSGCTPQACCDACSVFGRLGYNGRVSFSDAVAAAPPSGVRVEVRRVPIPWPPKASTTPGDFRIYDLEEATFREPGRQTVQKQPGVLAREVYIGTFETRMTFCNLDPQELGRILLALGLGTDRATRSLPLRGGVKYDGKGAVKVVPSHLRLVTPRVRTREGLEACGEECAAWIRAARTSEWAAAFWPTLEQLA